MHIFVCVNKCSCGLSSQSLCLCVRLCTEASIERRTARYNPAWMIGSVSIATGQRKAERRARPLCQCSVGKIITRRLWMHVVPLRTQLLPWIGRETIAPIVSLHAFLLLRLQQYLCIRRATPDLAIPLHSSSECNSTFMKQRTEGLRSYQDQLCLEFYFGFGCLLFGCGE